MFLFRDEEIEAERSPSSAPVIQPVGGEARFGLRSAPEPRLDHFIQEQVLGSLGLC